MSGNLYYLYLCLYLHLCFARAAQYLVSSLWILRSDCGLEQSQEIAGGILQLHSEPHPQLSEIPSGSMCRKSLQHSIGTINHS